jgi:hypothetical protein
MAFSPKKFFKRLFIGLGIFLVLLIGTAFAIPYFFKDRLVALAKETINKEINAKVDFKDVSIGIFRTFPDLNFTLEGLTVDGVGTFKDIRLAEVPEFEFRLDIMSVIKKDRPVSIKEITVRNPKIHVLVLQDGQANYDIAKPSSDTSTTTSSGGGYKIKLNRYGIYNAEIIYDDRAGGTYAKLVDFTHYGSGKFTDTVYDLETTTKGKQVTVSQGAIPYLSKAQVDAEVTLNADMDKMKFTFKDNDIKINDLGLKFDGWLAMPKDDIDMDLKFSAPDAKFSSFLSMIPAAYTADFKDVQTEGVFNFSGWAKGTYNDKSMPAFKLDLNVDKARFKYPDLPLPVEQISAKLVVNSPSADFDRMVVDLSKFNFKLGANPFSASLLLKTPMSDPDIKARVDGKLNLAELSKAFPMEGVKELTGLLDAKLNINTRMSYVNNEQYDKVGLDGHFKLTGSKYKSDDYPLVTINDINTQFTPNNVKLYNMDIKIGKSDIKANGTLDNLLTYFSNDKIMLGDITVRSNILDLNEIMGSEDTETSTTTTPTPASSSSAEAEMFDKWDFNADVQFNTIMYDKHIISGTKATGHFSPSAAVLQNFEARIGKNDIKASGKVRNWWGYLFGNEIIVGILDVQSNNMNLNDFMEESSSTSTTSTTSTSTTSSSESSIVLVPGNIDFQLNGTFANLTYDKYELKDAYGALVIRNKKIDFNDMKAKIFGGSFIVNGSYNTQNEAKPDFALDFNIDKFRFDEVAKNVITIKKIAPIIEHLTGAFNTKFKMAGSLDKDMMPDLNTLFMDGLIETFDAMVKNYKPVNDLNAKLGIKELSNFKLDNTVNFFTVKDGKFNLQPVTYNVQDMAITAGGSHSLTNEMNYNFNFQVPKTKLQQGQAGAAASSLINDLNGQASKVGVNLNSGDYVRFNVIMGGTALKPTFKIKFLDAPVKSVVNQLKDQAKAELDKKKQEFEDKAKAELDKKKAEAEAKARAEYDKFKADAEARAKAEADKAAQQIKDKVGQEVKDKTGQAVDQIKDKAKDALKNPFGKKN